MIYIGIGSNLNGNNNETPLQNCKNAIKELKKEVNICKISSWYKSEPIPFSNQSWYLNGVVEISTNKSSIDLLGFILSTEGLTVLYGHLLALTDALPFPILIIV